MKLRNKLRINWSKRDRDLMGHFPLGICTKSDLHYLFNTFNKDFTEELTRRGYNIETLKFSIEPLLPNTDKFKTLSEIPKDEL